MTVLMLILLHHRFRFYGRIQGFTIRSLAMQSYCNYEELQLGPFTIILTINHIKKLLNLSDNRFFFEKKTLMFNKLMLRFKSSGSWLSCSSGWAVSCQVKGCRFEPHLSPSLRLYVPQHHSCLAEIPVGLDLLSSRFRLCCSHSSLLQSEYLSF